MIREIGYDEVFDAQRHFRAILDSMARPGKINRLDPVELTPAGSLNRSSVLVAFALMDGDTTFEVARMERGEGAYLSANTNAVRMEIAKADFVFASGEESPEMLESANCGTLTYPDQSATLVLQVACASAAPASGSLKLSLEGPGVNGTATLFVSGLSPDLLLAIEARNAEFPLGLDTFLTFEDESGASCVVGMPRTVKASWELCQ